MNNALPLRRPRPESAPSFLVRGHPELAQAYEHLPVLPSGRIVDVLASGSTLVAGNSSAQRWTWIVMMDAMGAPESFAIIEAIDHASIGFAPIHKKATVVLKGAREVASGQTTTCSGRPGVLFRPSTIAIRRTGLTSRRAQSEAPPEVFWRVGAVRVGGQIRTRYVAILAQNQRLQIGQVLPYQTISVQVTRTNYAPWPDTPELDMRGVETVWTTHKVKETATIQAALALARPDIRGRLEAQI